jgi:antitoxin component YwqK of YwqJK toxin-antitoxin module
MSVLQIAEIPYPSGALKYRCAGYPSEDGASWIRHGLFLAYYEDGTTKSEGTYSHGVEHGEWRDFHANGQIAAEGLYENGEEVGIWRFWSADGVQESSGAV